MKILVTGANGYIGMRLLPVLVEQGHEVVAFVRSSRRLDLPDHIQPHVQIVTGDLLQADTLSGIPSDIDAAYYLVHSMSARATGFADLELRCAENFAVAISKTQAKKVIYLSGLARDGGVSEHMQSRHRVEEALNSGQVPVTTLRAGIIIGSGSASFEIIRDLVEKLPVMIAPRWVSSRCQPIAISDVIFYLCAVLDHKECVGETFEIGGPDTLTYKEMLLRFAKVRGLKRWILSVPVLSPKLSSYWLFFITAADFSIARALVKSLTTDATCSENRIQKIIPHDCLGFEEAIRRAFVKIEQNAVVSSWKDALIRSELQPVLKDYIEVPRHGCLTNSQDQEADIPYDEVIERLWAVGGSTGWYYMNWAWTLRGWLDQLVGGIGLRRGRTHPNHLSNGDALDFWRVLRADRAEGDLLLYAEMRLPGEAWLEWHVTGNAQHTRIRQKATFRPRGLFGRLYWYALIPFHIFIFSGMCRRILGK